MRHERKFLVGENFKNLIKNFLLENKFTNCYPSRLVNSIYYDSFCFRRYHESEDGISDRSKCRIRFYNSDIKHLNLEYKSKFAELGSKHIESLQDNKFKTKEFEHVLIIKNAGNNVCKLMIPKAINNFDHPSLFVSYKRDYYVSLDNKIRLTIDSNLNFGKMRNGNLIKNYIQNINYNFGVLEVKYDFNQEDLDIVETLASTNSLNLTRFSKYCLGVKSCY
tara:strand:+ start:229 stop:891 length:663 start_codon:yes stop_codon:yes gene_type:complete